MSTKTTIKVEADVRNFVAVMQQAQGATNKMAGALERARAQWMEGGNSEELDA